MTEQSVHSVIDEAAVLIHGARQGDYGSPAESFGGIAALWSAYTGTDIGPHDVAMMMILLKVHRSRSGIRTKGAPQRDSLVDIIGYAGCSELVQQEQEQRQV